MLRPMIAFDQDPIRAVANAPGSYAPLRPCVPMAELGACAQNLGAPLPVKLWLLVSKGAFHR